MAVPDEDHPGSLFLHGRLWEEPVEGPPAPFSVTPWRAARRRARRRVPDPAHDRPAARLYNTGVQSNRYSSPLRRGETIDLSPEDAARLGVEPGEMVRVSSRRGSIEAPVRLDPNLRPGLAFMTFHFPDQVDVNMLTIDATDPKSGTAEFKATAVRVEKLDGAARQAARGGQPRGRRIAWTSVSCDAEPTTPSGRRSTRSSDRRCRAGRGRTGRQRPLRARRTRRARERHQLLPTLHAVHERVGWISPGALDYIADG